MLPVLAFDAANALAAAALGGRGAIAPLLLGDLTSSPLGTLLLALVAIAAVILVGRVVLSVAWKLVVVATIAVGALWVATTLIG